MVSQASATHATARENTSDVISIDANHSNIVKFESSSCSNYVNVSAKIISLVETATSVISKRFDSPKECIVICPLVCMGNPSLTNQ